MTAGAVAVVMGLASTRKAVQLYPSTHPRFAEAVEGLIAAVRRTTASGPLVLNLYQGRLYLGSSVLPEDQPGVRSIAEALEARRIESITLHPAFNETDALGLTEVLGLKPLPELDVEAELASRAVANVVVSHLADEDEQAREERDRLRQEDRALYSRLVSVMRSLSSQMGTGGAPDVAAAGGLVGDILQRLMDDQAAVLGLATMSRNGEESLFHSINVMIYSLTLGSALGLPEEGLTSLGMSALLHDIGKAAFDGGDPEQAQRIRLLHPSVGAQILSRLPEEDKAPMLVAYEHHMAPDGSGYPQRDEGYVPHPFSRIVAIADRYDALTKPDAYGMALTPDRAVMQLLEEAGRAVDDMFARLFVKALGVFPVGCLVRLDDHSVGVVCGMGSDPLAPPVRLVFDSDGLELDHPEEVGLSESGRSIVEVVSPDSLAMEVSEHL